MRVTKSDISLELDFAVDDLSPAQLAAYERVANEHNAIKNSLKNALSANEGKELFSGQVFQAYSFKGKVLQELKEATIPKKPPKPAEPAPAPSRGGRKRASNYVYLESSDEEEDDMPLAKRIAVASTRKHQNNVPSTSKGHGKRAAASSPIPSGKASPQLAKNTKVSKASAVAKGDTPSDKTTVRPSELTAVGGLVIGTDSKDLKDLKDSGKELKLQGKTFPSLVVLAKPWLKIKDMSATRSKLDSKVKLVLMLTPNKFTEWLIQEGLLKSEQKCDNHPNNELKLGVYSDATKFPYTGGYVWIADCCSARFVSVFHGSIFEGAPHPPSCILKLIYHWSCQTNIQNVVSWVKVDNVYIKGVYTWLRAVCTLAVHQKLKKLGGPDKFIEVGVISLGTTSQDGMQRQVKVEVLGVLDYADKTVRLRAVEPVSDADRNYKKRFQTILEPLQRWVHKDSIISIDLTVDKMTLYSMGFKNIVQAAATDTTAKHTNAAVMDYLRRIVPRMFQNTLSLLSRQMIQQFLDELVWREQFGTYALQAFNNITAHIGEQTRLNTKETLTQRLYQVATNPFKDWSVLPANCKETPAHTTPKRLKKPINDADYQPEKLSVKNVKKEKESLRDLTPSPLLTTTRRRAAASADEEYRPERRSASRSSSTTKNVAPAAKSPAPATRTSAPATRTPAPATRTPGPASRSSAAKATTHIPKKYFIETKSIKKEEDDLKGLEEMYYGVRDGNEENFESFPYLATLDATTPIGEKTVDCPICDINESYDSNEKLQTHLVSHINNDDGKNHQFQCLFCLDKLLTEGVLAKHNQVMHPTETKTISSGSYHCIICQQRFNTVNFLVSHLAKTHSMLELPYCCYACGYRSSSHRDVVRHFYDDHKNQNFLQCPFCLDIFRFAYKGIVNISNIDNFYMHLRQHVGKKDSQYRCQKCCLSFVDMGALKQHSANQHISFLKSVPGVRTLLDNSMLISPPKVRTHHREPLPFTILAKTGDFFAFIDGSYCAECNSEIISEKHYPGLMKCNKCNYKTSCERAMFDHSSTCNGANSMEEGMEMPLPDEMHCICGFSSAIGNKMAHHLAICGQKSAYATVELAQENTVKRNMLDMLGLVRRDGESGAEGDDAQGTPSDPSADQTEHRSSVSTSPHEVSAEDKQYAPIQFGEMEAVPIDTGNETQPPEDPQYAAEPQTQYSIATIVDQQLSAGDIDMPLMADLSADVANPEQSSTQFLDNVQTPMFDDDDDDDDGVDQQQFQRLMGEQSDQQE